MQIWPRKDFSQDLSSGSKELSFNCHCQNYCTVAGLSRCNDVTLDGSILFCVGRLRRPGPAISMLFKVPIHTIILRHVQKKSGSEKPVPEQNSTLSKSPLAPVGDEKVPLALEARRLKISPSRARTAFALGFGKKHGLKSALEHSGASKWFIWATI